MAVSGTKYSQVSEPLMATDGGDSKPVAGANRFKVGMKPIALIVGSGLMLVFMKGASTSSPTFDGTSNVNLVGLPSVARFPSGGAVKPGLVNSLKSLRGSSPFQNAMLANNLQGMRQDVKVRHGDGGWDEMPADVVAKEVKKLNLRDQEVSKSELEAVMQKDMLAVQQQQAEAAAQVDMTQPMNPGDVAKIVGGMVVLTPLIIFAVSHAG